MPSDHQQHPSGPPPSTLEATPSPSPDTPCSSASQSSPTPNLHVVGKQSRSADPSEADDSGPDLDLDDPMSRPTLHRPTDGRSQLPLLQQDGRKPTSYDDSADLERPRPRRTPTMPMRSRSPATAAQVATRKKYTYAGAFLLLSLVAFTIQTETAVYIQHTLGWKKAYCMLYLTHGSWSLLWPTQLLILRLQKRKIPWPAFWRQHVFLVRSTAQMVETQELHPSPRTAQKSPIPYILKMTAFVTTALTVAGGSWYVAVDLTTASDLTAIYNCSAFFAYAFSIPILKEKLRWDKVFSVAVAIIGVLVVAYGDAAPTKHGGKSGGSVGGQPPEVGGDEKEGKNRALGNVVIGIGSVLYGLYEVLYKKHACPPEGTSPGRGMIFANTFGSLIGSFTLLVLWIPLPILHVTGIETFELPTGEAAWMLLISVLANASQPLSPAAIAGGLLIIAAFAMLTWSTWREMNEEKYSKLENDLDESDSDD
ncbi:MAG: hypothetical protein M1817_004124 [Caeruleum heppii]|nr:MAG: hypothetical protein M1817_004124 [Caeruleum heppii]